MSLDLHIAPSTSAGGCIKHALHLPAGRLLDNSDLLSCGPLRPLRTLDEWISIREKYVRTLYPEFDFTFESFHHRDLLSHSDLVRQAGTITIWVGTGLEEQLFLVWLPQFLRLLAVDPAILRVIQFSNLPQYPAEIQSVAALNPELLKDHPTAMPLDRESMVILDAAWAAITSSEPWPLVEFLAADASPLPFLKRSLRWLLRRLPDVESGLNDLQMQLLAMVEEQGPDAVRVIGYTMARTIDWLDWPGDAQLFAWLKHFGASSLRQPLVLITGDVANMREAKICLTETGRRVLARELNFVTLNGIDEWVGGIHLDSSADRVWFQRNGVIVAGHNLRPL